MISYDPGPVFDEIAHRCEIARKCRDQLCPSLTWERASWNLKMIEFVQADLFWGIGSAHVRLGSPKLS